MKKKINRSDWKPSNQLLTIILHRLLLAFPKPKHWKELFEEIQLERPGISRTTYKVCLSHLKKIDRIKENRISRKNVQYSLSMKKEDEKRMLSIAEVWKKFEEKAKEHSEVTKKISQYLMRRQPLTKYQTVTLAEYILNSYDLTFRKALEMTLELEKGMGFMQHHLIQIVIKTPLEQTMNLLSACFHHHPQLVLDVLEREAALRYKMISSLKHRKNIDALATKYVKDNIEKTTNVRKH